MMSGINTTHKVYLKVLTPVHIGGAQEKDLQEGLDYIQFEDGETWQLDWEKVYRRFTPDEVSEAIINKKLVDLVENDINDVAFQIEQSFGDTKVIKSFIRDGFGQAYIPGSSIKGAMKNWLYSAYDTNSRGTRNLLGSFETDLFRFIKPSDCYCNDEVMNYPTKTFNLRKAGNNWEGGWKHSLRNNTRSNFSSEGFVTDYECFQPDQRGSFSISIAKDLSSTYKTKLYDDEITTLERKLILARTEDQRRKIQNQIATIKNAKNSYEKLYSKSPVNELFAQINSQMQKHIERELAFFKKYENAEYCNEIVASYENLLLKLEHSKNEQCILRLSAGSGFHGITGDFQFQDHTNTGLWTEEDARKYKLSRSQHEAYVGQYQKFKSRKIAFTPNAMFPMGFVLLSTTPFDKDEPSSEIQTEKENTKSSIPVKVETKINKEAIKVENKNAANLKQGDEVFAEVLELGKPHGKARLFVENYSFDPEVLLSGIKNSGLSIGNKIRCEINSMTEDGKINMIKFSK